MVSGSSSSVAVQLLDAVWISLHTMTPRTRTHEPYSRSCSLLTQPTASQDAGDTGVLRVHFASPPTMSSTRVYVSMHEACSRSRSCMLACERSTAHLKAHSMAHSIVLRSVHSAVHCVLVWLRGAREGEKGSGSHGKKVRGKCEMGWSPCVHFQIAVNVDVSSWSSSSSLLSSSLLLSSLSSSSPLGCRLPIAYTKAICKAIRRQSTPIRKAIRGQSTAYT